jgi:hypothetical protein
MYCWTAKNKQFQMNQREIEIKKNLFENSKTTINNQKRSSNVWFAKFYIIFS